jgi:hypothetical protein
MKRAGCLVADHEDRDEPSGSFRMSAQRSILLFVLLVVLPACPAESTAAAAAAGPPRDRPSGIPHPPGRRRPNLECVSAKPARRGDSSEQRPLPTCSWADEEIAPCRGGGVSASAPSVAAQPESLTVTVIRVSNPADALTSSSFSGAQEIATLSLSTGSTVEHLFAMLSLSPTLYTVSFTGQVRSLCTHPLPAGACSCAATGAHAVADSLCAAQHLDSQSNRTLDSYGIVNGDVLLVWGKQHAPQGALQEEAAAGAGRRDVPALVLDQILSTATCEEADAQIPSYAARGLENGERSPEVRKEVAVGPWRGGLRQASMACVSCVVVTGKIALMIVKASRRPAAIPPTYQYVSLRGIAQ